LPDENSQLEFPNLNTELASIYIEPIFIQGDKQSVRVIWADEESSERFIEVSIIKGLDFSNYITIAPRGKVSDLNIVFFENNIAIKQVELNKKIPMAIMPIRLLIIFGISLLLLCLKNTETRKKISYFCFDYLYDRVNFRQRIGFAILICFMLIFNFLISYSTYNFKDNETVEEWLKMYSHHMTDALLKRQLHLDFEVSKELQDLKRPYDSVYRKRYLNNWKNVFLDHSYYKGKLYSYYGMVPVIILFAPYKLITGNYLPTSMGTFLFASVATILLMLLWKQIAHNYLKKLPYFFFLIGGATLYAFSLIPISLATQIFHLIAQYSALVFVILGLIMLLQAREKLSIKLLIISSLSFALAVGCRPTALFWSILIPVVLWDKRKELINSSKYLLAIIIPFVIVGSILAYYNYARFDSPFSFGDAYAMMSVNNGVYSSVGIIGKINFLIKTFLVYLFNPPILDFIFPFVLAKKTYFLIPVINFFIVIDPIVGIFCFPIMWFLFYARKVNILRNLIFAGIFISLLNITLFAFTAVVWRYTMDFSWIIAIGALVCAFQLQEKETAMRKVILKTFYSCSGITLLLVFFLTISFRSYNARSDFLPITQIFHYLARTFGDICNVP
jgi:hypothetical protein